MVRIVQIVVVIVAVFSAVTGYGKDMMVFEKPEVMVHTLKLAEPSNDCLDAKFNVDFATGKPSLPSLKWSGHRIAKSLAGRSKTEN